MWAVGALKGEPASDDADLLPAVLVPFAHAEAFGSLLIAATSVPKGCHLAVFPCFIYFCHPFLKLDPSLPSVPRPPAVYWGRGSFFSDRLLFPRCFLQGA